MENTQKDRNNKLKKEIHNNINSKQTEQLGKERATNKQNS